MYLQMSYGSVNPESIWIQESLHADPSWDGQLHFMEKLLAVVARPEKVELYSQHTGTCICIRSFILNIKFLHSL